MAHKEVSGDLEINNAMVGFKLEYHNLKIIDWGKKLIFVFDKTRAMLIK